MTAIDPATSLGVLVAERPARARLFERLRFDYCCGGGQSLAEACAERGLDAETVSELLRALDEVPDEPGAAREQRDWRQASISELCDHIVSVHHQGLRRELPRISELLETVVRVHGEERPSLAELERQYSALRSELETHLVLEEGELFPAALSLESGKGAGTALGEGTLALLEHEHADTGRALAALRELADDYDPERALCGTHRALLDALRELELDLHQHIHEENNVLFPRALAAP